MLNEIMLLRPHHGMCMAYFIGRGYSGGFTANLTHLLETLTPESPVCLTLQTDEVCRPCPHNADCLCDQAEMVAVWDREVLELCGLGEGYILKYGDFMRIVRENVLELGLRPDICGECQWSALCTGRPRQESRTA